MLKHRLIFGFTMFAVLMTVVTLDALLDQVNISGTPVAEWTGRDYLPAGLIMLAVFLFLAFFASRELVKIFHLKDVTVDRTVATIASMVGGVMMYVMPYRMSSQDTIGIFATLLVVVFMLALFVHSFHGKRTAGSISAGAAAMFALIYLGVLPGFFLAIRRWHDAWVVVAIIMITKCCDIGAYFTGRAIGRHKLIPWLSPGKTWEGLAGGVLLSGVATLLLVMLAQKLGIEYRAPADAGPPTLHTYDFSLVFAFIAGSLMGAIGQAGDLTASLFKRDAGVKDSGDTIPGFGGVIDVVDSPLVVAPFAYWLLVLGHRM